MLVARRRLAHALEHIVVRNDLRAFRGILNVARHVAAGNRAACFSDRLVSAGMVRIVMGIHDIANGTLGERSDRGQQLVGQRRNLRIHNQDAIAADLQRYIPARAHQHVHIPLRRQDVDLHVVQVWILLPVRPSCGKNQNEKAEEFSLHRLIFNWYSG